MKRKFSDMNKIETKKEMRISKPDYLLCEICGNRCYNYELCFSPYIYCSRACYEVLFLSKQTTYFHEKPIKRTYSKDDLMSLND